MSVVPKVDRLKLSISANIILYQKEHVSD